VAKYEPKRYIPFINNWPESNEWPKKEQEATHEECRYLERITIMVMLSNGKKRCESRYKCNNRDLYVNRHEIHCKKFDHR